MIRPVDRKNNDKFRAVCYVDYINPYDELRRLDPIVLTNVHNMTEAMQQVEEFFGERLISVRVHLVEESVHFISEHDAEVILKGIYLGTLAVKDEATGIIDYNANSIDISHNYESSIFHPLDLE